MKSLFLCAALVATPALADIMDIAARGKASQTTEYNGGQFPAANAIDGNAGTFSHTDVNTAGNAWKLTFDRDYPIKEIVLTMRGDCCAGRLNGATFKLANALAETVFTHAIVDPGQGSDTRIALPAGAKGNVISVGFEGQDKNPEGNRVVHLGEVKIMADVAVGPAVIFTTDTNNVAKGSVARLTWDASGAVEVRLAPEPGDLTAQSPNGRGTLEVRPSQSTRYTLSARDATGWGSASVVVRVDGQAISPVLTEFLADNKNALADSTGKSPAWVEIYNADDSELDLTKLRLTTDKSRQVTVALPGKLAGGSHGVVFLGERVDQAALALDGQAGGYLALLAADGSVASEFTDIPKQRQDVSYGADATGQRGFFLAPTPNAANGAALLGFTADTKFSINGGFFGQPFDVAITCETPQARLYYTLDGSVPAPTNTAAQLYTAPLRVSITTVLRVAAHHDSFASSNVDTQSYFFLADVLKQPKQPAGFPISWGKGPGIQATLKAQSDYEMDPRVIAEAPWTDLNGQAFDMIDALRSIPTLSLVMDMKDLLDPVTGLHPNARKKGRAWERPGSFEYFGTDGQLLAKAGCGLRMTGGWNRYPEMLKKSFRLYFRGEYGSPELNYPIFPDSEVNSYDVLTLRGGNGKAWPSPWRPLTGSTANSLERTTYLRDELVRRAQRDMGQVSAHGTFAHLYINGLYWGLYNVAERINDGFAETHFGGQAEDYDVVKWIRSEGPIKAASGKLDTWNLVMRTARKAPETTETLDQVAQWVDFDSLIDFMLANFHAGNIDWQDNNTYAVRNRNEGKFRFVCWDAEETFLGAADNNVAQAVGNTPGELFSLLRRNAEFRLRVADHIQRHYFGQGALTDAKVDARFMEMAREIDRAIVGESARWGDAMRPSLPFGRTHWLKEIDNLRKNYFGQTTPVKSRRDNSLKQMTTLKLYPTTEAPLVDPAGGYVTAGTEITISKPSILAAGEVYFTTDGSDPRLRGGAVHASARQGFATLSISQASTIKARVLNTTGEWSALIEARYIPSAAPTPESLAISEIMYHPADETNAEFLELWNRSANEINLAGLYFSDGLEFRFGQDVRLAAGERAVLVSDAQAFTKQHGASVCILGQFQNASQLSNGGEEITLRTATGAVIQRFRFGDDAPWPASADGQGYSLVLKPGANPAEPSSWLASAVQHGTPGKEEGAAPASPLADDNGDGIPNLVHQALAGSGPLRLPSAGMEPIGGQNYATFTHTRREPAEGATIAVEESTNLETWVAAKLSLINTDTQGGISTLRYRGLQPVALGERRYFRLKVTAAAKP